MTSVMRHRCWLSHLLEKCPCSSMESTVNLMIHHRCWVHIRIKAHHLKKSKKERVRPLPKSLARWLQVKGASKTWATMGIILPIKTRTIASHSTLTSMTSTTCKINRSLLNESQRTSRPNPWTITLEICHATTVRKDGTQCNKIKTWHSTHSILKKIQRMMT